MGSGIRVGATNVLDGGWKVESLSSDQRNYLAYVADRVAHGGWGNDDVAEYREAVGNIMANGTDDEKLAARQFWALKADA